MPHLSPVKIRQFLRELGSAIVHQATTTMGGAATLACANVGDEAGASIAEHHRTSRPAACRRDYREYAHHAHQQDAIDRLIRVLQLDRQQRARLETAIDEDADAAGGQVAHGRRPGFAAAGSDRPTVILGTEVLGTARVAH